MLETYKSLSPLSNQLGLLLKQTDLKLEDLPKKYQENHSPLIFAYTYCKLYPLLQKIANHTYNLTDEDKCSFILAEIHTCLLTFNPEIAKIQTMIATYVSRRLYKESKAMNSLAKKANNIVSSFNEDCASDESFDFKRKTDLMNMEMTINQIGASLTHNEAMYCKTIINNSDKLRDVEVAKLIGITSAGVSYIRKCLKVKLPTLLPNDICVQAL